MEVMLKEKNEANKRLPKNVKFNQSFDVGKQCADYLKHAPSATFDNYLECYKSFARFLRDGMPSNVMDFLMNPSKYDLTLKEMPSVRVEEDNNLGHDQQLSQQEEVTIKDDKQTFVPTYKEVPNKFKENVYVDAMIKTMPADGACLYNCCAEWLLGSHTMMKPLRREAHQFILTHFDFYRQFISLPFKETVGVGEYARTINIHTYEEMMTFLNSEDSMYCYSNSSLDLNNIATLFNIKIAVFVYSSDGSIVPRWDWILPNQDLLYFSPRFDPAREPQELWLYNNDNIHYDLLVPRQLCHIVEELEANLEEEVDEKINTTVQNDELQISNKTVFSPMEFINCKRGVGRPKKKRFGAPNLKNQIFNSQNDDEPTSKRKRGRPAGSKNKVKEANKMESGTKRPKLTMREKAEMASLMEEEVNYCFICEFTFDHPLKMHIAKTRCDRCN